MDNDRLNAMLRGAKNLMSHIDEKGVPEITNKLNEGYGHIDTSDVVDLPNIDLPTKNKVVPLKNLNTSKMDPRILESLKKQPSLTVDPNASLGGRMIDPTLFKKNQVKQPNQQKPLVNENVKMSNNGSIMVNPEQLKQMVKDCLLEFMTTTFTKNLSETVIKTTIKSLISEGKITAKTK
jgi:hypothetical protein